MPVLLSRYQLRKNLQTLELDSYNYLMCDQSNENIDYILKLTDEEVFISLNASYWENVPKNSTANDTDYLTAQVVSQELLDAYSNRT